MPLFSGALPAETLPLRVHPAERGPLRRRISASLAVAGSETGAGWLLSYRLEGDLATLAIPAPAPSAAADGLWRHTCFEAFVQDGNGPAYREFNFSPSGQWALYRFASERQRAADDAAPEIGPAIHTERAADGLTLQAWLPLALLPSRPTAIGLTAVIEGRDGALSHWALHHPRADRPDFHHRDGWTHRPALPLFPDNRSPA